MRDREFMAANQVMTGIVKTLKREGADKTNHHPPISEGYLQKMYSSQVLSNKTPTTLVRKVWFEIMLHFCRRGREGLRNLTSMSFILKKMTMTGSITPRLTMKLIKPIMKASGLSRNYTNHCVRATTATVLAHAGVSSVVMRRGDKYMSTYPGSKSVYLNVYIH